MKFEKLTDNKIRIILDSEELLKNDINLNDILKNNTKSQKFVLDILNRAEKEIGFYTKDCKILIEAFSSLDEIFVFTITKYENKKVKPTLRLKKDYSPSIIRSPIYKFSDFEEFCSLCNSLYKSNINVNNIAKKIYLYFYNDTYYLVFSNLNLTYKNFKKLFSTLSEFAILVKNCDKFEAKLLEYGKPVIKNNALRTGIKYFVTNRHILDFNYFA